MLENFVPLLGSLLTPDFLDLAVYPLFFGYFVASIPGLIRLITRWR